MTRPWAFVQARLPDVAGLLCRRVVPHVRCARRGRSSRGEAAAIRNALEDASVGAGSVEYINAHATSTRIGDRSETDAIREVFGGKSRDIHVSSCKSMLGHMLGAAGAVETAVSALSIREGTITPTINLEHPDPDCDLNYAVSALENDISVALTNSFGFGGTNAVLVLKKFEG